MNLPNNDIGSPLEGSTNGAIHAKADHNQTAKSDAMASVTATGSLSSSYVMSFTVDNNHNQHTRFLASLATLNETQIALMLQTDTLGSCQKLQDALTMSLRHANALTTRCVLTAPTANTLFQSIASVLQWHEKQGDEAEEHQDTATAAASASPNQNPLSPSSRKAALCQVFVALATFCEQRQIRVEQQHRQTFVEVLKALAKIHIRQGEPTQARKWLEKAVQTESTFLPKSTAQKVSLAVIRNDLAVICMELQDMDAALQHYQAALNLQREAFSNEQPGHPAIIMTLQGMAQLYLRCSMHEEALKMYHYILMLLQQQTGRSSSSRDDDSVRTEMAATLSSMGLVYYALRDYSAALQHYKQVLTIQCHMQQQHDTTTTTTTATDVINRHFEIATTLNSIGMIQCEVGNYDEARDTLQASLAKHLELFRNAKVLVEQQQRQQQQQQANNNTTNPPQLARHNSAISAVLYNLAVVYIQRGEDEIALQLFGKSIQFKKAVFGGRACPEMATNLQKLGGIHLERGEHKVAIVYLEEALQMLKQSVLTHKNKKAKANTNGSTAVADASAPLETLYHQLIIVGNLHLASGNVPGMMSYLVEACRLLGSPDAIQRTGLFTLGAYSLNRIHPRCASAA